MRLFDVNLPPLPSDKRIHLLAETPLLARARLLLIVMIVLLFASFGVSIVLMVLLGFVGIDKSTALSALDVLMSVVNFATGLCMLFACCFLSKLSLREAPFKLAAISTLLDLFSSALMSFDVPSMVLLPAAIFQLVVMWRLCKELSFITSEPYFFLSMKIVLAGLVAILVGAMCMVFAQILGAILSLGAVVLFIAASIVYIIAAFRIRLVIAYGANAINPL